MTWRYCQENGRGCGTPHDQCCGKVKKHYSPEYLRAWHALEFREPGEPGYGAGPDDPMRLALPPLRPWHDWVLALYALCLVGLAFSMLLLLYICLFRL